MFVRRTYITLQAGKCYIVLFNRCGIITFAAMPHEIDISGTGLPVSGMIPQIQQRLAHGNTLLLSAPPGAGKSTVLPLALLHEPWLQGRKIMLLEPRRLAASSIAQRMAALLGEPVGRTIGYRIRFEQKISAQTRLEVVTEGILTRLLQRDNALEEVGLVIFDEFHERRIHSDVALAFSREVQQLLRPDLRLLIMSATLDTAPLAALLQAPVLESPGRQYPVTITYTGEPDSLQLPEACAGIIRRALAETSGDILVFLPGESEIRRCGALLDRHLRGVSVHLLYGQLSHAEQQAAILPHPELRKVVLATNIAETSLTIEGVSTVVDSGFCRVPAFDAASGLSRLQTKRISLDMADQRAGRAGRLGPGTCYRMWSAATQLHMAPFRTPEIMEADLTSLMLDLAQWGVRDAEQLSWVSVPPAGSLQKAATLLQQLDALRDGRTTPHGRAIQELPCHPRLAHMLLRADQEGLASLATDIAALLEERDPLPAEAGTDLTLRVEALRRYRRGNANDRRFANIERVAAVYRKHLGAAPDNGPVASHETGLLLSRAYPERIAQARTGNPGQFLMANGRTVQMPHQDDLSHEPWLAVAHADMRGITGRIFLAAPVNKDDIRQLSAVGETIAWDTRRGGLVASRDTRLGSILLESVPLADPDPGLVQEAVARVIEKEGRQLLDFNDAMQRLQHRLLSLRAWRPHEDWPDVCTATLLQHNREWLSPYMLHVRKNEDLKRIDLAAALRHSLAYEQQSVLDRLAPGSLPVPSGSQIRVQYFPGGEPPVLSVRLQEVFGWLDTPCVNEGKTPVVMHLLSPGYKPVQVTSDLRSFWGSTYFEVRRELKRRYPKHAWPEDPLTAQAIRGPGKRRPAG